MHRAIKGFTLVELILVILMLGIVSTSVTSFISYGARIYQDVSGRDKQISDSRFVIERITREIRNAVPNSVRVSNDGTCVEFIPILASSSYVDIPVLPDVPSDTLTLVDNEQDFDKADTKFVVYPLTPNDLYVDSDTNTIGKIFDISNNAGSYGATTNHVMTITLSNKVLFNGDSPTQRYFIIKDSVAYCQSTNGNLFRYQGHDFTVNQANQTNPPTSDGVLMAERQSTLAPFSLQSATLVRNAIVVMDFTFTYDDEILRQVNEINIANVP